MNNKLTIAAVTAALGAATLGWTTGASAFPHIDFWHMPASGVAGMNRAGAGGLYGTGGAQDHGILCSHCHIEADGNIDFTLTASPAFQSAGGVDAYVPGQRYTITVTMTGGDLRGPSGRSINGMALAIEDANGQTTGRFITDSGTDSQSCPANAFNGDRRMVPAGSTTFVSHDCHAVLSTGLDDQTSWTFDWVAPAAGAGDLNMFVAVVDGNTLGDSSLGDDVVERVLPLHEGS